MMGFLKKIFGTPQKPANEANSSAVMASEDLERIEQELKKIGHGYEAARLQNRAGDLYLVKGDRERALKRYGDAIDAYLLSGEYDNAMAVCRKIIRVVPEVIRTRRTLAWLCLGKGFIEIAREHVEAYVKASAEAGLQALAVQDILLLSQYVDRRDFRDFLAERLVELGDEKAAKRVSEGEARDNVRAAGWTPVVFAATLTADDLRRAVDKGVEINAPTDHAAIDELGIAGFDALLFDPEAAAALEEAAAARQAEEERAAEAEKVKAEAPEEETEEEESDESEEADESEESEEEAPEEVGEDEEEDEEEEEESEEEDEEEEVEEDEDAKEEVEEDESEEEEEEEEADEEDEDDEDDDEDVDKDKDKDRDKDKDKD
jgi:hypothetical protein